MIKRLLLIIFIASEAVSSFAQDPEFTQFYAAPLYLNPAFAGSSRCPRLAMNYRNQWPALSATFVTYSVSYDQHVDVLQGGLGLLVLNDKAGDGTLNTTNVSGIYSYQLNVTRQFSIKAGFQATYVQKKVDWDKLTFGDMIDPRYGFVYTTQEIRPNDTRSFVDLSAGILAYSSKIYAGVAVNHLTEPDESFLGNVTSPLPMKITGHAGAVIPLETGRNAASSYISPNILYQQQQDFTQLNLGLYVKKGPLVGGLWYRNKDAVIILLGVQQGMFKFGYSYDVTVSKLAEASKGSHEASFVMEFECKPKKKKFRTINCPSF